jgi:predicted nucleic acid-binding protein
VTAVIDSSALVAYCLRESGLDNEKMRKYFREGLVSINLIKAEASNAILIAKRKRIVNEDAAKSAITVMLDLVSNNVKIIVEDDELLSGSFDTGPLNYKAIYDLLYISLAKRLGLPLVSRDEEQLKVARKVGVKDDLV